MRFPDLRLRTDRLLLRPLRASDAAAVQVAAADPDTQAWLPLPNPYRMEHAEGFINELAPAVHRSGQGLIRAIELDGELAGCIDFKRTDWAAKVTEIGYWSAPAWRGRGVMTEATAAFARWALTDGGFERVELRVAPGNAASLRVAEKAGFTREGIARNAGFIHAGRVDLVVYSLIRADLGG